MTATVYLYRHAKLLRDLNMSGATVEDLARAWASIDGKRDEFDAEKKAEIQSICFGHYQGYLSETEEALRRAVGYAMDRRRGKSG